MTWMGGIIHLEPDILECEVKWVLRNTTMNKTREVMEFQLRYFKSYKIMLLQCCTQYASKFGKLKSGHRTGKSQFLSNPKEGQCQKCSNYLTIVLISQASKVILKILQARLQQYVNQNLPDVQIGFRKSRRTRDKITSIHWTIEKPREFQKEYTPSSWVH